MARGWQEEKGGATVLVMDDGHQNFALRKSLSLVVVDAETGFGNGFQIPAGPLREPVAQGLGRANAVMLMGDGAPELGNFSGPVLRAHLKVDGEAFAGKPVFAFAGIGRPEKFVASLQDSGAEVIGQLLLPRYIIRIRRKRLPSSRPLPARPSWSLRRRISCA